MIMKWKLILMIIMIMIMISNVVNDDNDIIDINY